MRTKIIDIGKGLKKLYYINNPYFKNMETVQNELYRKLTKKSLQEEEEKQADLPVTSTEVTKYSYRPSLLE